MQEQDNELSFYEGADMEDPVGTEREGITGKVTSYTFTGVAYPCVIFKEDFKCPKHKMEVVSNMVKSGNLSMKDIALYIIGAGGALFKIGALSGLQVGAFLDLIGVDTVDGFYDKSTPLKGDRLYTLCAAM